MLVCVGGGVFVCGGCSGSIRANLDPFKEYSDEQVTAALEAVELKDFVEEHGGMHGLLTENGGNASIGQRQVGGVAGPWSMGPCVFSFPHSTSRGKAATCCCPSVKAFTAGQFVMFMWMILELVYPAPVSRSCHPAWLQRCVCY